MQESTFHDHIKHVHTFDEAIELTENGKFQRIVLWTTGFALLGVIIEGLNMAFVLPLAKCELNLSNAEQGAINAATFIGVVLTSHFWGFLADTWGRRKVLIVSLGSGFVFSAISSFSVSSTMMLVTRLFVGLTISGVSAAGISYLGEFHCDRNRSKFVTLAVMFMSMGVFYQALMGIFIMPIDWEFSVFGMAYRPWRFFILLSSLINALAFVSFTFLPESPKFMMAMGMPNEALEILKKIHRVNKGDKELYPVHEIVVETIGSKISEVRGIIGMLQMMWKQTRPLLQQPHFGNMLTMCILAFILFGVAHGFYMWFPQILSLYYKNKELSITTCSAVHLGYDSLLQMGVVPASQINETIVEFSTCNGTGEPVTYYIILIMGFSFGIIYVFVALYSQKYPMKFLICTWLILCTVAVISIYWTNNFNINIVMMIIMMTCGNCGTILNGLAGNMFPTHYKGMALCFVMMFGRIGTVAGSNFIGAVIHGYCDAIFMAAAPCLVVAAAATYYILQKHEIPSKSK